MIVQISAQCANEFNFTAISNQKCLDESDAGYFFLPSDNGSEDFIIWLGDTDLCPSRTECFRFCQFVDADGVNICSDENAFNRDLASLADLNNCYYRRLSCTSANWFDEPMCPTTFMEEFSDFNRVFIPQCTHDLFIGNNLFGNSPFRGFQIFSEVLADLMLEHGLGDTSNIIFGGSRYGGVGAANLVTAVETIVDPLSLRLMLDSSWLVKSFDFGAKSQNLVNNGLESLSRLETVTSNWLESAVLDPDCRAAFEESGSLVSCLFLSELMDVSSTLKSTSILFVQSQYDGIILDEFGVLDSNVIDTFSDAAELVSNGIQFIEAIGSTMRTTVQSAFVQPKTEPHVYFASSCSEHGILFPVNLLEITTRTDELGAAGTVNLTRSDDTWELLRVDGASLKDVVTSFLRSEFVDDELFVESCGTFLCGENCEVETDVQPFIVDLRTSETGQNAILFLALLIIVLGWLSFTLTYIRVLIFRRTTKSLWDKLEKDGTVSHPLELIKEEDYDTENIAFLEEFAERKSFVSLSVKNLSYLAPPRKLRGEYYPILNDVNICVKPGEVHGLMGPSGSGKSTLLDVLSLNRGGGIMIGTHLINGVPSHLSRMKFLRQWLRHNLSYVRQQDVLFPLLTVRQHLTHAAWLMLPESMSSKAKIARISKVTKLLGLEHALDTKIGDGGIQIEGGISGGERRRVSVATQLLSMPAGLVLDEPTSGLDSTNALLLVNVLHKLAHEADVAVLLTIHQPRREIFNLFDKLTILLDGVVTFSGSPEDAGRFFRFNIKEVNIGDDILDKLEEYRNNERAIATIQKRFKEGPLGKKVWARLTSEESYLTASKATELRDRLIFNAKLSGRKSWEKATSTWLTTKVLLSRTMLRGGFDLGRTTFVSLVGGVLVGTVFFDNDSYTQSAALAYLIVATMSFLQATFLGTRYQLEKGMWTHEKEAGADVSWKAFLSSLYMRNVVTSTIEGLAFSIPAYTMGNLNTDKPERFPLFLVLLVLVATCVIAQNTFVEIDRIRRGGISGPDLRQAALVNMTLLSMGAIFNGFIIPLDDIPPYLQWVPNVMLTYWGFVGILVNNFRDFEFPCDVSVLECATRTGDSFIVEFGYEVLDVYQAILGLSLLILFFHIFGTLDFFLRFVWLKKKMKRRAPENDQVELTDEEKKHGFVGSTMALLVTANLTKSQVKQKKRESKTRKKKSKKKSRAPLTSFRDESPRLSETNGVRVSMSTKSKKKGKRRNSLGLPPGESTRINLFSKEIGMDDEVEV